MLYTYIGISGAGKTWQIKHKVQELSKNEPDRDIFVFGREYEWLDTELKIEYINEKNLEQITKVKNSIIVIDPEQFSKVYSYFNDKESFQLLVKILVGARMYNNIVLIAFIGVEDNLIRYATQNCDYTFISKNSIPDINTISMWYDLDDTQTSILKTLKMKEFIEVKELKEISVY